MRDKKPLCFESRSLTDAKLDEVKNDLKAYDWNGLLRSDDVNENFEKLCMVLNTTLDKVAPINNVRISWKRKYFEPWMTMGIERASNKCKNLYKESLKEGASEKERLKYTHTMVHINEDRIWATMDKAPSDYQQLSKMCEYHLVFLGHGRFAELVEQQHPLISVELTNRDVKVLELGVLTYDEEETLNNIIFCGLGFTLGSGEPFIKDIEVKKQPHDSGDSNNDDNLQKSVSDTDSGKLSNDLSSLNQRTDIMDKNHWMTVFLWIRILTILSRNQ